MKTKNQILDMGKKIWNIFPLNYSGVNDVQHAKSEVSMQVLLWVMGELEGKKLIEFIEKEKHHEPKEKNGK